MDLKFTFGSAKPLPLAEGGAAGGADHGHGHAPAMGAASSTLELRVSLESGTPAVAVCEARSGDGVSYARAEKAVQDPAAPSELAAAARSVLARAGATLPEPLLGSVTDIVLALGGAEPAVLTALGIAVDAGADPRLSPIAAVDAALQARTGIEAGTPIHVAAASTA